MIKTNLNFRVVTKQILLTVFIINFTGCKPEIQISDKILTKTFNYPVLKGKENNPVLRIQIENTEDDKIFNEAQVAIDSTVAGNLKNVRIFYTGQDSIFNNNVQFGTSRTPSKRVNFKGSQTLENGKNYFWISYELKENCNLTSKVWASLDYIELGNKRYTPLQNIGPDNLRLGVAVRQHGDDNVHTFRIPGLTTSNNGTLLATYDIRRESGRDLQGDIDIGVSRSVDGGNSWEPMRIALDMGEWGGLPEKFNGVSDANILVDKTNGAIYIAGLWMYGVLDANGKWITGLNSKSDAWNHQWRDKGSQPGFGVKQTAQFLITKSTDDGKTWSEPINLTEMCKDAKWWLWAPAPGHGITLSDGTLVLPTQGRDQNGLPFSNITFSKDEGLTWKTSKPAAHNTTECMAVELTDGNIMLNMRDNRNHENKSDTNGRFITVTADLGETWKEHPTSHGALIEPTCMASIHRHDYIDKNGEEKSLLFFSNPNSKYKRIKQTIKVSMDDGRTWPKEHWIELDEGSGAGYSCLTSIDNDHIGILYEGSQAQMTFQKIAINEFIK